MNDDPAQRPKIVEYLRTMDSAYAGYRFIQGVSRVAYRQLSLFSAWREANDFSPANLFNAPAAASAPSNAARDLQRWSPLHPATALPASEPPAAPPTEEQPPA